MRVAGRHFRTIWMEDNNHRKVRIIDQRQLPHRFVVEELRTVDEAATAIREMHVRGAGLIGVTAGYGMYLAALAAPEKNFDQYLAEAAQRLKQTRPTARNLAWAIERQMTAVAGCASVAEKRARTRAIASEIADEDAEFCRLIGDHGLGIIREISGRKGGRPVNILTHCNAGWLAFVDYGSATAPIYAAHREGIPVHIWVDETRPWLQGAKLTAWELGEEGIPHTLIADNTGGHLMQHGEVDMVIVGTDRTTRCGDVANKIGTYLKALAARDNDIPFYVALPSSTFDWTICDGILQIPIEQRSGNEVKLVTGQDIQSGDEHTVRIAPPATQAANYAFDVTPARLVTALITERGVMAAQEKAILRLYPEFRSTAASRPGRIRPAHREIPAGNP